MATIHEHAEEVTQTLGSRLHAMRESRQWTLEKLGDHTGLSKAYLSRLEAGDRQPSIVVLCTIAKAFGVTISALFEQPDESAACVIVRGGSNKPKFVNGLTYQPLSSSTKPFNLHPIGVTIPPDRGGAQTYQHDGEEWLHVVSGRAQIIIDGARHVLEPGDSAHFDSRLPHRLDALDDKEARVILVACSIPTSLNRSGFNQSHELAESSAGRFVG
jgi:DNA-binding XRE family transcriptional regulator/quercetin dioxygenase-like cupin family protein